MEERELFITHKMVIKDTQMFLVTDLKRIVENLKRYENIEKIELDTINGHKYIVLTGRRTMYGYKVEDGGFFDVINDIYHNPYMLEHTKIIEMAKIDGYIKKKVR